MSADRPGRLMVTVPSLPGWVRPTVNVIATDSLRLVETGRCEREITVPAGTYLVSATLPSGERSMAVVEVAPGGLEEVELAPETTQAPNPPVSAVPAAERDLDTSSWFLRFRAAGADGAVEHVEPPVDVESVGENGRSVVLLVHAVSTARLFAQLARRGEVPLNVALPVFGSTITQTCRLEIESSDAGLATSVTLPRNPLVDTVARYLYTGNLQDAAGVIANAEQLLGEKQPNPFGAALGGYALVRLRRLDRLHEWPRNLAERFPWLPDGAIVAGEHAALAGDHAAAVGWFCQAARRGFPVFADGFSILTSRLRSYGDAARLPAGVKDELRTEAAEHLGRLLPIAPLIDFSRISFAFHGASIANPAGTQEPLERPAAGEGWRRFQPVEGRYWVEPDA